MLRRSIGILIVIALFALGLLVRAEQQARRQNVAEPEVIPTSDITFRLEDRAAALGVQFQYEHPVVHPLFEAETKYFIISGGVSVGDVNDDGWMDFYVVTPKQNAPNALFINQQGKGFINRAAEWGVANINVAVPGPDPRSGLERARQNASLAGLFFDYNNDGKVDLYIAGLGCSSLFRNTGTQFEDVSVQSGLRDCENSQSALPFDYNDDGFLDLYVLRHMGHHDLFELDTDAVLPDSPHDALNGGDNTLYRNNGDGTFSDVTQQDGGADSHWSFDAAVGDFTGNGAREMLISNDFGADRLFEVRDAKLIDVSERLGSPDRRAGMGVSIGFLGNDEKAHLHVSNAYHERYRHEGNFLWRFAQDQTLVDEAHDRGSYNCGWAWGSAFADFDLDGVQDLYIANGFVSETRPEEMGETSDDLKAYIAELNRATESGELDVEAFARSADNSFGVGMAQTLPGALLSRATVLSVFITKRSFAGHQTDCLFLNRDGALQNVASAVGIDRTWDGRSVAVIDYDNNGALDLIVTSINRPLPVFHNPLKPGKRWIGFRLRSAAHERDVYGARVVLRQGETVMHRITTGGKSGLMAISDPRVHFGLPSTAPVDLEIRWPDGRVQSFFGLEPGKYHELRDG